jgi:hypothetical protein
MTAALFVALSCIPTSALAEEEEGGGLPVACGSAGTALPHGSEIHGQAGSAAQLYFDPVSHKWYVSYQLETNSMSMGADETAFFTRVVSGDSHARNWADYFFEAGFLSGDCKLIGVVDPPTEHWVLGGATGFTSSQTCEYSIWAEFSAGIKIGPTGRVEGSVTLGGSYTCANGVVVDSEILISESNVGSVCPPFGCHQ